MKKILLSSDPNGNLDLLLPKVTELHNKNKFDLMLITGSVFPSTSSTVFKLINDGKITVPLPIYFVDSSDMSVVWAGLYPDGHEIAPNLHYLGNCGVKNIQGINIAFMSGMIQEEIVSTESQEKCFKYSKQSVKKFIDENLSTKIDILLTSQWCIEYASENENLSKSQIISQLCYELSPRYHLSASGSKFTRLPPFKGSKGNPTHFINVAEIKQSIPKDKYLVAIQMNPDIDESTENVGENKLMKNSNWDVQEENNVSTKEKVGMNNLLKNRTVKKEEAKVLDKNSFILFEGVPEQVPNSQISEFLERWGEIKEMEVFKKLKGNKKTGIIRFKNLPDAEICLKDSGKYTLYQSRITFQIKHQNEKYSHRDCFLCQKSPTFNSSLVAFKTNFCFLSVDIGPVVEDHFQIVPINHVSSTGELEVAEQQEIGQIRTACQMFFNEKGFTFICIERYMNLSEEINHAIIHCIPIKIDEQELVSRFRKINYESKHGFEEIMKGQAPKQSNSPYYIVFQINGKKFLKNVDRKDKRFEQGRQIVCEIIDKPEKLNWRDCQVEPEAIKSSVDLIQSIFK